MEDANFRPSLGVSAVVPCAVGDAIDRSQCYVSCVRHLLFLFRTLALSSLNA